MPPCGDHVPCVQAERVRRGRYGGAAHRGRGRAAVVRLGGCRRSRERCARATEAEHPITDAAEGVHSRTVCVRSTGLPIAPTSRCPSRDLSSAWRHARDEQPRGANARGITETCTKGDSRSPGVHPTDSCSSFYDSVVMVRASARPMPRRSGRDLDQSHVGLSSPLHRRRRTRPARSSAPSVARRPLHVETRIQPIGFG